MGVLARKGIALESLEFKITAVAPARLCDGKSFLGQPAVQLVGVHGKMNVIVSDLLTEPFLQGWRC